MFVAASMAVLLKPDSDTCMTIMYEEDVTICHVLGMNLMQAKLFFVM